MTVATDVASSPARAALRRRRLVAFGVLAGSWATALVALLLSIVFDLPLSGAGDFTTLYLVDAVAWGALSALLIARRAGLVAAVLAVLALGSGISALAVQLGRLSPRLGWHLDQGIIEQVLGRLWLPGTLALLSFVPLLVTSRPIIGWTRRLVWAGAIASTLPLLATVVRQRPNGARNPLALPWPAAQDALVLLFFGSLAIVLLLSAVTGVVLIRRWRAANGQGIGWLALGHWMLLIFLGPSFLGWVPGLSELLLRSVPFAPFFALLFAPAALIVAALGQRLWGIDLTVNRAAVSVLLFAALLTGYAFVALVLTTLLPVPPMIAGVVGVVALTLALGPVRRWIQRRVDALIYGDAAEPAQLIRRLGQSLPAEGGYDNLLALTQALRETLRLGSLELRAAEAGGAAARAGFSTAPATVIPLRSADAVVGEVLARANGTQRLDRRTRQVLERIAGVLAVAVQFSGINREVREARDRAREVGDEERRMVRRELHDGLAPGLESAARRLDDARLELGVDPPAAHAALADVREALATRTAEVRDLARTLLPGALDAGDLGAALRELAVRFERPDLRIEVVATGLEAVDPARQAAIHHLVAEAVLLARRALGKAELAIGVTLGERVARIAIRLDAELPKRDAAATARSIRDRATELGGSVLRADFSDMLVEVPR